MTDLQVLPSNKRELWRSRYQQWQSIGLSVAAFSRQNDLNLSTFYFWNKVFDRAPVHPGAWPLLGALSAQMLRCRADLAAPEG